MIIDLPRLFVQFVKTWNNDIDTVTVLSLIPKDFFSTAIHFAIWRREFFFHKSFLSTRCTKYSSSVSSSVYLYILLYLYIYIRWLYTTITGLPCYKQMSHFISKIRNIGLTFLLFNIHQVFKINKS